MKNLKQKEQEIKEMRETCKRTYDRRLRELCTKAGFSDEETAALLKAGSLLHGDDKTISVLGKNIKKQRLQQGISLQELSDETLMPVMHLEDIEKGNIDADITDIHLIAKFINSPVYVLYIGCD